jgi:RNA polymerase sigma-54 factor
MVERHLAQLARGRFAAVARDLGVATDKVADAWVWLRDHLRPPVVPDREDGGPARLRPDLVFGLVDGDRVTVTLTSQPRVRLHPSFVALAADLQRLRHLSRAEQEMVTRCLAAGATFMAQLEQRGRTLHRVGTEVARRQRRFLRDGPGALVPLTRAEVAAALGLHESTVSRAVSGKWVLLPTGRVVALADLFGASRSTQDLLRRLVAAEQSPSSDAELAAALAAQGHPVSRSAVRKYRQQLGIPAQHLR